MSEISIKKGYLPGSIGRITELHGLYYHQHWKFDLFFEAKVSTGLSKFLERYDEKRDGFWLAILNYRVEGAIAIDGIKAEEKGAHLRWFIVSDTIRGTGVGNQLLESAIALCRDLNYKTVYLWTFEGLHPARHLYEKTGFKLIKQHTGNQWGTPVKEQKFELIL